MTRTRTAFARVPFSGDVLFEHELVQDGLSGRAAHKLMRRLGVRCGRTRLLAREKLVAFLKVNAGRDLDEVVLESAAAETQEKDDG
jgi:hypothetical protein